MRLGQPDLAWMAVRNALDAAQHGSDELQEVTLRSSIAHQLLTQGRDAESRQVALNAADRIEPSGDVPVPQLSAYGHLLLMAASASGRGQRAAAANDFLATAGEVAGRIGYDRNDYETTFGPTQVTMQTVGMNSVTECYTAALGAADRLPRNTTMPAVSRARNLYDQAFAHTRLGNYRRATDALLAAEHLTPDLMRYHMLPRTIVAELLEHDRTTRLRDLARRLRVTGDDGDHLVTD